jgi:hypothetical protein
MGGPVMARESHHAKTHSTTGLDDNPEENELFVMK